MMVLRCWTSSPSPAPAISTHPLLLFSHHHHHHHRHHYSFIYKINKFKKGKVSCLLKLGVEDVASIVHNKVLIAAGVSAVVGQFSKPFTCQLLYGDDFDFMRAFQAGGFPSTHSSAVIAAATSLALERGFSDSIFGVTLVYAGLVMYDAQGVRREVGNHARALNKLLPTTQTKSVNAKGRQALHDSSQSGSSSNSNELNCSPLLSERETFVPNSTKSPVLLKSDNRQTNQAEGGTEEPRNTPSLFKESIGHTEVEVIAGALLGFLVSLAVYNAL